LVIFHFPFLIFDVNLKLNPQFVDIAINRAMTMGFKKWKLRNGK